MTNLLIKNGLIVNGAGTPPEKNDIFIRNGKIVEIGNLKQVKAQTIIDAVNMIVVPGFIDVNSEIDHSLEIFSNPKQINYLRQGVTTVIGGNGGWSLAPIINEFSLDFLTPGRQKPDNSGFNFHWQNVGEFLHRIFQNNLGVNFGTLVGYSNIRRALTRLAYRDLSEKELETSMKIITESVKEGALGCSLNFNEISENKIPFSEIRMLMKTLAKVKGLLAIRFSGHPENLFENFKKIIVAAKEEKVNLEFNRFQPFKNKKDEYSEIRKIIEESAASHLISFDCDFSDSAIVESRFFLPSPLNRSDRRTILDSLGEKEWIKKIIENFRNFQGEEIIVRKTIKPFDFLNGRSLIEFAKSHDLSLAESFIRLMRLTNGRIDFFCKNIDEKEAETAALSVNSLISSSDDGNDSFEKFLKTAAAKGLSIEKIIAKLTSLPAQKYGLNKRGAIRKDNFADIVILRDNKPVSVIVNGRLAINEGIPEKVLAGRALRSFE
ncbi:MAG: hypothetical protein Q8L36_02025 [bacterium]|nr:hypothetical protein [bacterium]